jgi:hypothetical protein
LRKLGYSKIPEMVNEILAGKSVPLQAEAVKTLGNDPQNEELLIKFADDRQKPIRLAAYEALANLNTETAQRVLVELFVSGKKKSDIPELGEALKINHLDKFIPVLLEKAKADYEKCLALDESASAKAITIAFESFMTSINLLINNVNKDILEFCKDVFTNEKYCTVFKLQKHTEILKKLAEKLNIHFSVCKNIRE